MSFEDKQSIFTSTELDYEEIVDIPDGYEKALLSDFDDDGDEKTVHRFKLFIFQDDDETYVEINVNLKNGGDIHKNIRKGSVLFDFLTSILELENAGCVGKSNIIRNVNLAEYREFVNRLSQMSIKVKERAGTYAYYSFLVKDVKV